MWEREELLTVMLVPIIVYIDSTPTRSEITFISIPDYLEMNVANNYCMDQNKEVWSSNKKEHLVKIRHKRFRAQET